MINPYHKIQKKWDEKEENLPDLRLRSWDWEAKKT